MVKRKGKPNASSHHRPDSLSPNRPRRDKHVRLLSRLYEPLILLYTLGSTRGEHTCAFTPSRENLAHRSLEQLRRTFLNELAYMCDYNKGGETVTALGIQSTPQGHVFWVASNAGSKEKTIKFLDLLLSKVAHTSVTSATPECVEEVAVQCITFATPRIKKYRSHLKPLIRRCILYLTETQQEDEDSAGLVEWLQHWEHMESPLDLCRSAYEHGKSPQMRTLARFSAEPNYRSSADSIGSVFGRIRHYIGRIGYHFRAADILLCCAPRLSDLLNDFQVRGVPVIPKSARPTPDLLTTVDKILVRMLPAGSLDLKFYQQALAEMDSRHDVFRRFLENYTKPDLNSCVHAEIQVLEYFYAHDLRFPDDDPYIACSKPACFCCHLYFRNHPGHFIEPETHNKIYLNWRPPDLSTLDGIADPNHQRGILNGVIRDIRKGALRQIHTKSAPQAWHPDSLTGVTHSVQHEQDERPTEVVHIATSPASETFAMSDLDENSPPFGTVDLVQLQTATMDEDETVLQHQTSSHVDVGDITQRSYAVLEDFISDSDDSGGVLL